jgi:hypothetical protein
MPLLAAETQADKPSAGAEIIWAVLPVFIIAGLVWWFLRRYQRSPLIQRALRYSERAEQHMEKMEQLGERIAAALEKRNEK